MVREMWRVENPLKCNATILERVMSPVSALAPMMKPVEQKLIFDKADVHCMSGTNFSTGVFTHPEYQTMNDKRMIHGAFCHTEILKTNATTGKQKINKSRFNQSGNTFERTDV